MRFARAFRNRSCCIWRFCIRHRLPAPKTQETPRAIQGTVTDPSGAVVPNATSPFTIRSAALIAPPTTDNSGNFSFANVPFNPYHLTVTATGFAPYAQDVEVRSVGAR